MQEGLAGLRVVEFADQIAGPYCGKLFVDAEAQVIKIESPQGDPLRCWSATGADLIVTSLRQAVDQACSLAGGAADRLSGAPGQPAEIGAVPAAA